MRSFFGRAVLLGALAIAPIAALGQQYSADKPVGASAQQLPAYLAHAGVEQRLGQRLPLSATFTDASGHIAPLQSDFAGRPAVLALVYFRCAMLCPQVLEGLATGLTETHLVPGKDYDVIVASIDPMDTPADAARKKEQFLAQAHIAPAQSAAVHFLTGPQASIDALSAATGFHFVRVPGPDGKLDQFAHSSVVMFTTADGKLSKYLSGVNYPARDLRMALLDASSHRIANPVDLLILYCCSYNPVVGRYTVSIIHVLGIAGMITLAGLIGMVVLLSRSRHRGTTAA